MQYTREQIKKLCDTCGIDINQCLKDIDVIINSNTCNLKNKSQITKLMFDAEQLIKNKGLINETSH